MDKYTIFGTFMLYYVKISERQMCCNMRTRYMQTSQKRDSWERGFMEFKQVVESGTLKQIGNDNVSTENKRSCRKMQAY